MMTLQLGSACNDGPCVGPHPESFSAPVRPLELRQWATWLRLNAPRQTRGALRRRQPDGTMHVCAIGALEEIGASEATFLFSPVNEPKFMRQILLMNDRLGWTFPQIADWLDSIAGGTLSLGRALEVCIPADLPRADERAAVE